jgi:uncharacterized protein YigE (DUF2233 family)
LVRNSARAAVLAGLLYATGCSEGENRSGNAFDPSTLQEQPACEERRFEESRFTVCAFDPRRDELRLALRGKDGLPLRSLAALEEHLGAEAARVRFAMNAGMYDEEGVPIGLYVEDGKTLKKLNRNKGPGNFHLLPNGVFAVDADGRVSVKPTPDFARTARKVRWATQSGPMLVLGGKLHHKFDADGESRLVRNGVGVKDPNTAFFVISEEGVSFGRFARFFRDSLGCPDALFLDGSVSSLWDKPGGRQDGYSGLGPMAVVFRRE